MSVIMQSEVKKIIESAWEDRTMLSQHICIEAIESAIDMLDKGKLRIAQKEDNDWIINEWLKKAVLLYFSIKKNSKINLGIFEYNDKIPLKKDYDSSGVRVVPHALARYGSFLAPGVVLMPSYINIGAYVGENTMIDTWATVGSCAQVGKNVHVSGGVGIGGVLEPIQAAPVIIEDNCFIGSRSIIVEGAHIGEEAVLGANVVITASTKIIDVSGYSQIEYKAFIPKRSVVVPGSIPKVFPAGTFNIPCALIIGQRKESTNKKTSLNDVLREYNISV